MTPRQRRMTLVLGIVAGVGIAGALALSAFRSNVTFFFDPTAVAVGQVKAGEHFRLGGMVTKGSVKRTPGSLEVHFLVTDFKHDVPVSYTGVLPDLFREGTGVVAHGHMDGRGTFVADEVLAKHDEKYMPPEVARSLKRRHGEAREDSLSEAPAAGGEAQGQPSVSSQGQSAPSTTGLQAPAGSAATPTASALKAPGSAAPQAAPSTNIAPDMQRGLAATQATGGGH
jgi:cytochrome c-type biogenesis protein CcmE